MTFLYPSFLLALTAIAVPIIIHLIELRKSKRVLFTNVRFIREVKQVTSHHRLLKHLLVLAARILFISLLVLAFAQPFIPAANLSSQAISDVRIYLDNSLRMQNEAAQGEVSLLDAATDEAKGLLSALPPATNVFVFGNQAGATGWVANTPAQAKQVVDELALTPQNLTIESAVSRLSTGMPASGGDYQAFLFSDFQKASFNPAVLDRIDSSAQYYLIPVQAASASNVFVDSVYLEDEFVRIGESNKLYAEILNAGAKEVQGVNVKLLIGSQQVSSLTLDIAPNQTTKAEFSFQLSGYGPQSGRIEIEDFPVTFDNTFYFTLAAAPKIRVLDVQGSEPAPTRRLYTNEPIFDYTAAEVSQLNYGAMAAADVVLLNGVSGIDPGVADNLRKYVREGGNLVVIPAGSADRSSYSRFFSSLGLGQISWKSGAGGGQRELASPDLQNPFFTNIFTQETRGMQMPQADQLLSWSRSSANVLNYRNGGNYLSSFSVGEGGTVYVFASPLTPAFSEFSNHAIFVPIMYKLAIRSYSSGQALAYTLGEGPIRLATGGFDARKTVFRLIKDSVAYIPEQRQQGGSLLISTSPEMTESGIYDLVQGDSTLSAVAFNYNKRNSYLDQYSPEELRELVSGKYPHIKVYEASDAGAVREQFRRDNVGTPLWKYCLLLSLFFLLAEVALIRFM